MKFRTRATVVDGDRQAQLFVPEGLQDDDPVVIYIHGYGVTTTQAVSEHLLEDQFAASDVRALYVVPEAPSSSDERVAWGDLRQLLDAVRRSFPKTPRGPVVALGHSGAYRTIVSWGNVTGHRALLDGWYPNAREPLAKWIAASDKNRLILVDGPDTGIEATRFVEEMKPYYGARVDFITDATFWDFIPVIGAMRNPDRHMGLVTDGIAIPKTIQLLVDGARESAKKSTTRRAWTFVGIGAGVAAVGGAAVYAYSRRAR